MITMGIKNNAIGVGPETSKIRRCIIALLVAFTTFAVCIAICETGLRLLNAFPDSWPSRFKKYHDALVYNYDYVNVHGYYEPHAIMPVYADGAIAFSTADDLGY